MMIESEGTENVDEWGVDVIQAILRDEGHVRSSRFEGFQRTFASSESM